MLLSTAITIAGSPVSTDTICHFLQILPLSVHPTCVGSFEFYMGRRVNIDPWLQNKYQDHPDLHAPLTSRSLQSSDKSASPLTSEQAP